MIRSPSKSFRRIGLLLAFLLVTGGLIACGGNGETGSDSDSSAVSTTALPDNPDATEAPENPDTENPDDPPATVSLSELTAALAGVHIQMESTTYALTGGVVTTTTQSTSSQWNLVGGM